MKRAKQLLEEFEENFGKDDHTAEKILEELKTVAQNSKDTYLKAKVRLKSIFIDEMFNRSKSKELFDEKLLHYFEDNNYKDDASALLGSRVNYFLNKGNTAQAEDILKLIRQKELIKTSEESFFTYMAHWAYIHTLKKEPAQKMSVCLEALEKLQNNPSEKKYWHLYFLVFSSQVIEMYANYEEYDKAYKWLQLAKPIAEKQSVTIYIKQIFWIIAAAQYYVGLDEHENAIKCYELGINLIKDKKDYNYSLLSAYNRIVVQYFLWYNNTASSKKRTVLLKQIEHYIHEASKLNSEEKYPVLHTTLLMNYGRWELLKKNYAKADSFLKESLQRIEKTQLNIRISLLSYYRLQYLVYSEWWREDNDTKKLAAAFGFLEKVREMEQAEAKEKVRNKLDAVHGHYELEQKKLTEQLLQQQIEAMNKELQFTNLNLHEKVMVLDELKEYIRSLKKKEPEIRLFIHTIEKKIDTVKITEQDKALLQQKMNESGKYL